MSVRAPVFADRRLRSCEEFRCGADEIFCIRHACRLVGRVHGQLGQADVRGADGHMGAGDVAEGGSARHIGPVGEGLDRDTGFFADIPEHGGGDAVSAVFLAGVEFQHDAFVEIGPVGWIGLVRMVRVYGVGIVCGEHEAFRQADEIVLAAKVQAAADPLQRI